MYQEEIFSNVMTDAKRDGYDALTHELKGMEAAIVRKRFSCFKLLKKEPANRLFFMLRINY